MLTGVSRVYRVYLGLSLVDILLERTLVTSCTDKRSTDIQGLDCGSQSAAGGTPDCESPIDSALYHSLAFRFRPFKKRTARPIGLKCVRWQLVLMVSESSRSRLA